MESSVMSGSHPYVYRGCSKVRTRTARRKVLIDLP